MVRLEIAEGQVPIESWCDRIEEGALKQAKNLAAHPKVFHHVALMPDAHQGYGMPIGGVIACIDALIPNAVGVDIGCGMGAVKTSISSSEYEDKDRLRGIVNEIKRLIPVGEGHSRSAPTDWEGFERFLDSLEGTELPGWHLGLNWGLDAHNLGTLGGGNHFIEIQSGEDGSTWLMLHSGSRNLGYRIANLYHKAALALDARMGTDLPDKELAYLPLSDSLGQDYLRDMDFALRYAAENRRIMMERFKEVFSERFPKVKFELEVNIHHNYAAKEDQFGESVWVHRKGATSARKGELGIIPGSMGTKSFIVEGLGNPESFQSCSHGAGRRMGRADACRRLDMKACDRAMEGIVYDRWKASGVKGSDGKKLLDLSEAPGAYKDIDEVIRAELDLVKPLVELRPLAVVKG